MITKEQVLEAQTTWGNGVVKIGSLRDSRTECESFTSEFLDALYSFEAGPVLFKPTKCAVEQFRPSKDEAKSYFIAGDNRACNEDKGFAIKNWKSIKFENFKIVNYNDQLLSMGNYYFEDEKNEFLKVEYTFGFIKVSPDELRINLHHSSLPYNG